MVRLEDVLEIFERKRPDGDVDLIRRAHVFAEHAHEGQNRKSGEPYVSHPLAVAMILAELGLDGVSVAVAILHDVLEDTEVDTERLSEAFGDEVAKLVGGVTKIGRVRFTSDLEQQAVNFRKLLVAMVDDVRVLLVKLADRLHNMRTLAVLPQGKRQRIARETLEIYAPLAHRLGMARIHGELEDLSFKTLEPEEFAALEASVKGRLRAARRLTHNIERRIRAGVAEHSIPCTVEHRVKGLYSLHRKMSGRELDLEQVYDLVAFRIITDSIRSCYAVLGIIHNQWSPVPGRFKDFVAMPKPNMYQSLHTTLMEAGRPFEVQIRTEQMHGIAEEGIAVHWMYKEGATPGENERALAWLRQLVESQRDVSDPREFLSELKLNLYPNEVYVFTPKGDIKALPRGAVALDFAYMVHTEVGHHCSGAKVNGKLAPLRQHLKNGDIVEIVTSSDASPSRDWLQLVQTTRARSKIRAHLNKQERDRSVEMGRRMCEKELRKYGARLSRLSKDGSMDSVASQFGLGKADDLLVAVAFGKVSVRALVTRLLPEEDIDRRQPKAPPGRLRRVFERAVGWAADAAIEVKGIDNIMVYRARCCGPVPGEAIVGYVTRGKGVSVHARTCGNIDRLLLDKERRIDVVWRSSKGVVQPVKLAVAVDDRQGLLARLTAKIADDKTNIRHIESKMDTSRGTIELVVDVTDSRHLKRVLKGLRELDGVRAVRRGRVP